MSDPTVSFVLSEETEVSVGVIVNLTGQASFGIHAFKLEGVTVEPLEPTDNPDGISTPKSLVAETEFKGIYDLSGRKVQTPKRGIYIQDGRKVLR